MTGDSSVAPAFAVMTGFTGSGNTPVSYQGTTLVGPFALQKMMGFSPCTPHPQ
jgi:hypothetical protein